MPETRFITGHRFPPSAVGIVRAKRPVYHPVAVSGSADRPESFPASGRGTRTDRASPRRDRRFPTGRRRVPAEGGGCSTMCRFGRIDRFKRLKRRPRSSTCLGFPSEAVGPTENPFISCAFRPVSPISTDSPFAVCVIVEREFFPNSHNSPPYFFFDLDRQ